MNAGLDFETEILVKYDAPERLRDELAEDGWRGEPIIALGRDRLLPAGRAQAFA